MLNRKTLELTLIAAAHQQGQALNGKDMLDIRTGIASTLAAKERQRQRMAAPEYKWRKPVFKR
ncbi:MAG: hypothetical protein LKK36_09290 [Ewingella americana]|jgi:hypothetical protein|nr:hypothetical protein [Ewingella americana]MCI1680458.1 hypothetical protein [Ewingella americana]MCI1856308.1 hypothetical protein [Ewingella americana]MCI1863975.1 hypothetical protein [Ewingella americana]MCI2142987.1 hypothetical protein [Ewingella americana]MCI2163872.1 hypothetical protein [Ewingella americana]